MIINYEYDVFIAYLNANEDYIQSYGKAKELKDYLEAKGLKCFLFTDMARGGGNINYKTTFIEIMQSRFFLLVVDGDGLEKYEEDTHGSYNFNNNYHLQVEIDAYLALTQKGWRRTENSAIVCFTSHPDSNYNLEQRLQQQYGLFRDRSSCLSVYYNRLEKEDRFFNLYSIICKQISNWNGANENTSNELEAIYPRYDIAKREFINKLSRYINANKVKVIRCMGIKNTILSCDSLYLLQDAARRGVEIELFVLMPDSTGAKIRAAERGREISDINAEANMGIRDICCGLENVIIDKKKIAFYLYENVPRQNMISFETEEEAFLLIHEYSSFEQGLNSPTLLIRKDRYESPIYNYYENIFNNMRETACKKSFEDAFQATAVHHSLIP